MALPRNTIHICPLYTEISPLITPCLDHSLLPSGVVILTDHVRKPVADDLIRTFDKIGVRAELRLVKDLWNYPGVEQTLQKLLDEFQGYELALNLSSGITPFSIAAARFFIDRNMAVYQVNPENDHLIWLSPPDRSSFDLSEKMDLDTYFMAHGIDRVVNAPRMVNNSAFFSAASEIALVSGKNQEALSRMNHLGTHADGENLSVSLGSGKGHSSWLNRLLDILQRHGLARIQQSRLIFSSLEAKQFASGVWLEFFVQGLLDRLKIENSRIRDVRQGVKLYKRSDGGEVNNELDVCMLADNRFYMVECKSGANLKAQDSIYKLDAIRSFINDDESRGMVVVTKPVSMDIYRRAAEHDIRLCAARDLPRLYEILKNWVKKGH